MASCFLPEPSDRSLEIYAKGGAATIDLWPFASMRDFHGLRKAS